MKSYCMSISGIERTACWQGGTCIMVGAGQPTVEATQAAERHLKCKVLQLKPYRRGADNIKAKEVDSKEVHAPCLSCSEDPGASASLVLSMSSKPRISKLVEQKAKVCSMKLVQVWSILLSEGLSCRHRSLMCSAAGQCRC